VAFGQKARYEVSKLKDEAFMRILNERFDELHTCLRQMSCASPKPHPPQFKPTISRLRFGRIRHLRRRRFTDEGLSRACQAAHGPDEKLEEQQHRCTMRGDLCDCNGSERILFKPHGRNIGEAQKLAA
jgi:hypothetical protein